jgi:hypothetical protein
MLCALKSAKFNPITACIRMGINKGRIFLDLLKFNGKEAKDNVPKDIQKILKRVRV